MREPQRQRRLAARGKRVAGKEIMKEDLQYGHLSIDCWVWQHSWACSFCVPPACQLQESPAGAQIYAVIHQH